MFWRLSPSLSADTEPVGLLVALPNKPDSMPSRSYALKTLNAQLYLSYDVERYAANLDSPPYLLVLNIFTSGTIGINTHAHYPTTYPFPLP